MSLLSQHSRTALTAYMRQMAAPFKGLLENIIREGGVPIFVGGVVRDFFLDKKTHDLDLEVHGLSQESLEKILFEYGGFLFTGKSFGVYRRQGLEVSLPRTEIKIGERHQDFKVTVHPFLSFSKAARRRDLTMNAMGVEWCSGEFLDPYKGLSDIKSNTLRAVHSQTFSEDPLRALRVAVFIARFGFQPDHELVSLCEVASLTALSPERIGTELQKLFLSESPSLGLRFLKETGLSDQTALSQVSKEGLERVEDCWSNEKKVTQEVVLAFLFFFCSAPETFLTELVRSGFSKRLCRIAFYISQAATWLLNGKREKTELYETLYQLSLRHEKAPIFVRDLLHCLVAHSSYPFARDLENALETETYLPFVTAQDFLERGILPGPHLKDLLLQSRNIQYRFVSYDKNQIAEAVLDQFYKGSI